MKFLIQRVTEAAVDIAGETIGKIGKGYLVLIGVGEGDTREVADRFIRKMLALRIFADENSVDVRSREREPISYSGDMYDIETSK